MFSNFKKMYVELFLELFLIKFADFCHKFLNLDTFLCVRILNLYRVYEFI